MPADPTEPDPDEDTPDRIGPYRILDTLGAGGMGVVYLAEHATFGRRVALKIIRPGCIDSPDSRKRFFREAKVSRCEKSWISSSYSEGTVVSSAPQQREIWMHRLCSSDRASDEAGVVPRNLDTISALGVFLAVSINVCPTSAVFPEPGGPERISG